MDVGLVVGRRSRKVDKLGWSADEILVIGVLGGLRGECGRLGDPFVGWLGGSGSDQPT